jgi:hypothetical protein
MASDPTDLVIPHPSLPLSEVPLPPAADQACKTFEAQAGGREKMVEHLASAPLTPKQALLVGAIADPRNDRHSLGRICQLYGIQFSDLMKMFRDAGFAKAQLAAMQRVWDYVPQVAEDVMQRALPHSITCPCRGLDPECEDCRGRGSIEKQPELETQKLALQMGGLVAQPGGGVNISMKQEQHTTLAQSFGGVFSRFAQASDQVLFPGVPQEDSPPLDAEVVETKTEPEPETV